jgi:lipopolysaccharide biosynthesis protein
MAAVDAQVKTPPKRDDALQCQGAPVGSSAEPGARLIAYYLPQFHPIPENDAWWGAGFTEWTNVARARPLFPGHYQPHIPADLGFYDLRLAETRLAQAEMAQSYGIAGFCYYHYWFAGRRLLERPFDQVLQSGEPRLPFCLCWANETWSGVWHGCPGKVLVEQTYPGTEDHRRHWDLLLRAFADDRYLRVDNKPLFVIYRPLALPEAKRVTDLWRELALQAGLPGLYLLGMYNRPWDYATSGFDGQTSSDLYFDCLYDPRLLRQARHWVQGWAGYPPAVFSYRRMVRHLLVPEASGEGLYPCVVPNWDNTPRSGGRGVVLHGSTPELFRIHLRQTIAQVRGRAADHRIVFVKAWNEWAEGNHLEPDRRFGRSYLQVVKEEVERGWAQQGPSRRV